MCNISARYVAHAPELDEKQARFSGDTLYTADLAMRNIGSSGV
jgi:hypothetical protein